MKYIDTIIKDDWYKSASPEEMRVALMHVEMTAMDKLRNQMNETYKESREQCIEDCSDANGWDK